MTKWQESCITALASSPLAWEAFKMKQRNKCIKHNCILNKSYLSTLATVAKSLRK